MSRDRSEDHHRLRRRQETLLELTTNEAVVDGNFEAAARQITEAAVEILGVSRVNIWLFDDDITVMRCVDHFDAETGEHSSGRELAIGNYSRYFQALKSHRTIAVTDTHSDERTRELVADYLGPNDIASLLDATLRSEGEVVGVVCFEHVGETREWTGDDVQFAGDLADIVHRALRNRESAAQREQLEFRQSLLEAQHEAFPNGVLVVNDDGDILSYNDRFRELWGVSTELLNDGSVDEVFAAIRSSVADEDAFRQAIEQLFETPRTTSSGVLELDDGRTVEWYSTAVTGSSGAHYGRLWITRDITARRDSQAELERKNRAIDEAPIGITLADANHPDNAVSYVNDQFTDITGYSKAETLGRNCRFLQGDHTEAEPVAELRAAIEEEQATTVELRNYRKDGSKFWNRVTIAPVRDEDGAVVNYVGFQRDVTEYREATRQLKVLHRVLRHNLSNQLTIIRGYADEVARSTNGEVAEMAAVIVEEIDRLVDVMDKHREIVRLLDEQPPPLRLDLDATVDRVVDDIRQEYPEAELSVTRPDETIGDVRAIPALEHALHELLVNAIIHDESDAPTVGVEISPDGDDTVSVRITDRGPKIPPEEAQILTGEQEVTPLDHGIGMGLWLVYLVVTLSQGDVELEANSDEKSIVHVELPRAT
ncbi:PAS domain S-box-containing protein [Natronoarchaeum philippinense]|uniref:PAS domain S-box-containing protein n=1 Tax=Natronoarchaeum philippinense TaxID=558529 RepID=A0A285NUP8_NATPI|nr:PAS domain-containing protein [Natronoarchaeum philippinense]SNZ12643.1 PAS domain S-box-containing protein [Natronoarchaeum philippinense]